MEQNKAGVITLTIAVLITTIIMFSGGAHARQSDNGVSTNSTQVGATTTIPPQPRIPNTLIIDGYCVLSGTNGLTGGAFTIRSSTNLVTPFASWTQIGSRSFDSNGHFCVADSVSANEPARFYLMRQP